MIRRAGGGFTMEALALVSALCIAGIFVFAHYSRKMDALDQQAERLANKAAPAVEAFFAAMPQGTLSLEALKEKGFSPEPPFHANIPQDRNQAGNWRIVLWHDNGEKQFSVSSAGVEAGYR